MSDWIARGATAIGGAVIALLGQRFARRPLLRVQFPGGYGDGGTFLSVTTFVWNDGDSTARGVRVAVRIDGRRIGAEEVVTIQPHAFVDVRLAIPNQYVTAKNPPVFAGRVRSAAPRSRSAGVSKSSRSARVGG